MSTVVIVLIAIGVIAIIVAIYLASRRQVAQKREDERLIASQHREEAERSRIAAEKESALADEQAAAARRQAAEAEERAQKAQQAQHEAHAHVERADEIDPDTDHDEDRQVYDGERGTPQEGGTPPVDQTEPARRQT